jgi:hypothetical protein
VSRGGPAHDSESRYRTRGRKRPARGRASRTSSRAWKVTGARALAALLLALAGLGGSPAAAEEEAPAQEPVHWIVGAGGFVGLTGPARYGLAAEAQVFPARWPGAVLGEQIGLGLRYRGHDGLARGLVAAGLVYEAGATRPHIAIELHGDVGATYGPARPLLGGGARIQLGLWGPVALAAHADIYYWLDGWRPRPLVVPAVTLGLAR